MENESKTTELKTLVDFIIYNSSNEDRGITFINVEEEKFVSYAGLYKRASSILCYLQSQGLQKNSELIFQIDDNEYFVYIFWACILGGITAVPVTVGNNDEHRMKFVKIWDILNTPNLIIQKKSFAALEKFSAESGLTKELENIRQNTIFIDKIDEVQSFGYIHKAKSDDIAFVQFSSGSTGNPKGIILTHDNLVTNTLAVNKIFKTGSNDSTLSWLPLTHDLGLIAFHICCIVAGINQYIMPTTLFIRKPSLWLTKSHKHRITQLFSPNFGFKHLLKFLDHEILNDLDLSSIRFIANGAEPISIDLCNDFLNELKRYNLKRETMCNVYGLAEATVGVSVSPVGIEFASYDLDREFLAVGQIVQDIDKSSPKCVTFADVGYVMDNCEVRICDNQNNILFENTVGLIQLKGENVTQGYYNNKAATKVAFTKDGWLNTGDLGFFRNGRLVITGRLKDIIFVNGQNYYPHDLERIAESVEGIELGKIAACGILSNQHQTEDIILFVLFKGILEGFMPLSLKLKKHLNLHLGLEIKEVIPVKKMPKTTSGKIQRYKLGESYSNGEFSSRLDEMHKLLDNNCNMSKTDDFQNQLEKKLSEIWIEILETEEINRDSNFFEVGGNSLKATMLGVKISKEYDIEIPLGDIFELAVFKNLAAYISKKRSDTLNGNILNDNVILLNKKTSTNIFAFPPLLGFGIAYKSLANILNEFSFYSFNFIEETDRLSRYVDIIQSIQKEGPYVLIGFSFGGKLAFEVASELERRGYTVAAVIIVDSVLEKSHGASPFLSKEGKAVYSYALAQTEISSEIATANPTLKSKNTISAQKETFAYIMKGVKVSLDALNQKSMNYIIYSTNNMKNPQKVNATIYLIKSPKTKESKTIKWSSLARNSYKTFLGYGRHGDMIEPGYVEKNAEIIRGILKELL